MWAHYPWPPDLSHGYHPVPTGDPAPLPATLEGGGGGATSSQTTQSKRIIEKAHYWKSLLKSYGMHTLLKKNRTIYKHKLWMWTLDQHAQVG